MKKTIHINNSALAGKDGLKEYAIRGMGQLSEHGFSLYTDPAIDERIHTLLTQEGIPISARNSFPDAAQQDVITLSGSSDGIECQLQNGTLNGFDNWRELVSFLLFPPRTGRVVRTTKETNIEVTIDLDGSGKHAINTGLGFFDHMLEQIARHGGVDLRVKCEGDLHIDEHHTIEDTALALGDAISQALADKRGITRYASVLPMDETRAMVALDLSGRPYLVFEAEFTREKVGDVPTEMIKHFFYSLAMNTKSTLHIEVTGENDHHKIEAAFKGFAIVLKNAVKRTGSNEIPSSKGVL